MRLIEIVLNEDPPLVEMANLYKEDTGLILNYDDIIDRLGKV